MTYFLLSVANAVEVYQGEEFIRLARRTSKNPLFGTATKMTERDVYLFVATANITCPRSAKAIFRKEGTERPVLKSRENLYISLMDGLTSLSELSPTLADRMLVRMKASPLSISCVSAIKRRPEDLYFTILNARLTSHILAGKDELGDSYSPTDIVRACGAGSIHLDSEDCKLCARTYVSEADGRIAVSTNWEERVAAKQTCDFLKRSQSPFFPRSIDR